MQSAEVGAIFDRYVYSYYLWLFNAEKICVTFVYAVFILPFESFEN